MTLNQLLEFLGTTRSEVVIVPFGGGVTFSVAWALIRKLVISGKIQGAKDTKDPDKGWVFVDDE